MLVLMSYYRKLWLLLLICHISLTSLSAQTNTEFGTNDFQISSTETDGDADFDATSAAVAYNSTENEYLVVWQADTDAGSLVDGEFEIYGQRVNALTGALAGTASFRISEQGTDGDNSVGATDPAVAFNPDTNQYLVVWVAADEDDADDVEIYGQLVNANNTLDEDPFVISDMGDFDSMPAAKEPAVIYNSISKQFFVVWTGANDVEDEFEIYGRRVASDGSLLDSDDIRISDMGPDSDEDFAASSPALSLSTTDNYYLVAWSGDNDEDSQIDNETEIFVQQISASDGTEMGTNDLRVSDMGDLGSSAFAATDPAVAYDSNTDQFLVVWQGEDDAGSDTSQEIYGQFIDAADLSEVGTNDLQLSDLGPANDSNYTAGYPSLVFNHIEDEFLLVFQGDDDTLVDDEFEIFGQRIAAGSTRAETGNNDFRLSDAGTDSDTSSGAFMPSVAFNSERNTYLISWQADDPVGSIVDEEFEIFGQLMALRGADLAITASDDEDPVTARDLLSYTINVTNNGPDESGEVAVTADLPTGMILSSSSGTDWSCFMNVELLTCTIDNIENGDTTSVMPVLSTAGLLSAPISVTFEATAEDAFDTDSANDTATVETTVDVSCTGKKPKVRKRGDSAIVILPRRLMTGLVSQIQVTAKRTSPSTITKRRTRQPKRRIKFKNLASGSWRFSYVATLHDSTTCTSKKRRLNF